MMVPQGILNRDNSSSSNPNSGHIAKENEIRIVFWVVLGFKLRASCLLPLESYLQALVLFLVVFQTGSHVFALESLGLDSPILNFPL
jgi:hypothetical protein